jgi:lipid-binding SYLF domain-containing protein
MRFRTAIFAALAMLICGVVAVPAADADDYAKTIKVFQESKVVKPFFKGSYGYAVFPVVGKAGLVVGGAFGKGQVYRHGKVTGKSNLVKLSIGFQAGGQAFSEIIFFQDKRAYDEFTSGSFEFDATASAVAITAGAQAEAGSSGTSAGVSAGPKTGKQLGGNYVKGMAVFVHTLGGLMYEAAIGGQGFSFEPVK